MGVAAIVFAAVVALGACGVPVDKSPRLLSDSKVPFGLLDPATTTTTSPADAPATVEVFMLGPSDRLVGKDRPVSAATLPAAIGALLNGPSTGESAAGFFTFVNPQTKLIGAGVSPDGVATVNLSQEFGTGNASEQVLAVAQVVYTATGVPGVQSVLFELEGKPIDVPTEDGTLTQGQAVTRTDYAGLVGR
jgi:hypothetical protein